MATRKTKGPTESGFVILIDIGGFELRQEARQPGEKPCAAARQEGVLRRSREEFPYHLVND